MEENVRLNVRHEVGVCTEQLRVPELANLRQLSCKQQPLQTQQKSKRKDRLYYSAL